MLKQKPDIAHTTFTVIGAQRSGIAAARLLQARNARVFLSEIESSDLHREAYHTLSKFDILHEFGGHTDRALDADIMVLSPGVPVKSPIIQMALSKGIELVSEIELATWFCAAPIIAVTGTNGKTTTTALIGKIFSDAGWKTIVAGNIGDAFSEFFIEPVDYTVAVLEVSSYQLDHIHLFQPAVSIITTITPDHLDRYDQDFEKYIASKQKIFSNQREQDHLIFNLDNDATRRAIEPATGVHRIPFSVEQHPSYGGWMEQHQLFLNIGHGKELLASTGEMVLRGKHNYANTLMAALAARVLGVPLSSVATSCVQFAGVEHRLEFVRELDGVKFINDSKATNVDSLIVALESFSEPIILIAGGRDKGTSLEPLFQLIEEKVKTILLIGEARARMEEAFRGRTNVLRAASMQDAVEHARSIAVSGDVVLLSPACASFDMFKDFEHRGRVFKAIVHKLGSAVEAV